MLTKQKKTIAQLLKGGKPLPASISSISFPTAGTMERALINIIIPDINPVIRTLLRFTDFICLGFNMCDYNFDGIQKLIHIYKLGSKRK